jgi:hypothetical protein
MADARPALDAPTRAALEQLADIAVPAPVSWMPQTWGWAVLGIVVLALAAWGAIRFRQRRAASRYRREAMAELARIEARLGDGDARAIALAEVARLLKRVALAAWPRPEVASLSGAAWVEFLRAHAPRAGRGDEMARLLDDLEYRSAQERGALPPEEARALARAARAWVKKHRVSPAEGRRVSA